MAFILRLLSYLPFSIIYLISDFIAFLGYNVFRYRRQVVLENLRNSFPEKSEKEIRTIAWSFYRNLCDILVEIVKEISISREELIKRVKYVNPEEIRHYFAIDQSIIVIAIHQCNWEWLLLAAGAYLNKPADVLYYPLSNKAFDRLMIKVRSKFGGYPIPVDKTIREIARRSKIPRMIALLADQTPTPGADIYWTKFLNQETAFYKGPDVLARFTKYPVFFAEMTRIKRGYYEVRAIKVAEPPYGAETDILEKFAKISEKTIRENPASWLWSHRRWKLTKEPGL